MKKHKINWKRLWRAIKEEFGTLLFIIVMFIFIAIPWVFIFLTNSFGWLFLYPVAFFIHCVYENYNGDKDEY